MFAAVPLSMAVTPAIASAGMPGVAQAEVRSRNEGRSKMQRVFERGLKRMVRAEGGGRCKTSKDFHEKRE